MPNPFSLIFGHQAAKRIIKGREEDAKRAAESAFSPEDEKLIVKYRSKIITVPLEKKKDFLMDLVSRPITNS